MASRKTSVAPPVPATFPVDRSQVSVAPRRSVRTSKQNLTLIQEDSQKEILRKVLGSQRPPRASSNISRGQTRSRSRSGISCYVDIAALSKQLPLPPLVGSEEVGSPSSVCHFDLTSRGTSLGSLASIPGTPQSQSVPGTPQTASPVSHAGGEPADGDGDWPGFRVNDSENVDSGDDKVRRRPELRLGSRVSPLGSQSSGIAARLLCPFASSDPRCGYSVTASHGQNMCAHINTAHASMFVDAAARRLRRERCPPWGYGLSVLRCVFQILHGHKLRQEVAPRH